MNRLFCLSACAALMMTCTVAVAAETCTKIVVTGHPQYPAIAFKQGDAIVGAAPVLVAAIGKKTECPARDRNSWGVGQRPRQAAKDGKADMIVGIYYNDERAGFLDYVQPAFVFDPVVAFIAKDKKLRPIKARTI